MTVSQNHPVPTPERLETFFERAVYHVFAFPICFAGFFVLILFGRLLGFRAKLVRVLLFAMVLLEWHGGRWPGPFFWFVLTYETLRWAVKRWLKTRLAPEALALLGESAGVLR